MKITQSLLQDITSLMKEGYSEVEVISHLQMSKAGWYRLKAATEDPLHKEFTEALETGNVYYEAWLERVGKDLMLGKRGGKDSVWKAFMQNKFKWTEKTDNTETVKVWDETSQAEYDSLMKRLKGE